MIKQGITSSLTKIENVLTGWIKVICVILLALMVITISVSVFTRFVMFYPLNFADALAKYFMMWLVFLGTGLAIKEGEHILVDMLISKSKGKSKKTLLILTNIIVSIFLLAVTYFGFLFALHGKNSQDPFVFGMSMMIPYLSVPVGAFYTFIQLNITTFKKLLSDQEDMNIRP